MLCLLLVILIVSQLDKVMVLIVVISLKLVVMEKLNVLFIKVWEEDLDGHLENQKIMKLESVENCLISKVHITMHMIMNDFLLN